jgi:hypothetical protein
MFTFSCFEDGLFVFPISVSDSEKKSTFGASELETAPGSVAGASVFFSGREVRTGLSSHQGAGEVTKVALDCR